MPLRVVPEILPSNHFSSTRLPSVSHSSEEISQQLRQSRGADRSRRSKKSPGSYPPRLTTTPLLTERDGRGAQYLTPASTLLLLGKTPLQALDLRVQLSLKPTQLRDQTGLRPSNGRLPPVCHPVSSDPEAGTSNQCKLTSPVELHEASVGRGSCLLRYFPPCWPIAAGLQVRADPSEVRTDSAAGQEHNVHFGGFTYARRTTAPNPPDQILVNDDRETFF
ncbi:hypothetical protein EYF80_034205 [Liparis tanakae]|uniref:Uncharacterized protein n=1 Tax=Liparis tanakae TaxID=230148 RepID=A0A4Z2GPK5_9TELE|nr:hypothetical protein EYF80_034205 [Liparis tanakae]